MKRKIKCLVVEDEAPAVQILRSYLDHFRDLELSEHFTNGFDAQDYLLKNRIDLLFLDIQLPGISGLEFLRTLKDPPLIIITSAYSEHGVEAYDLEVFDYLLKPYSLERFSKAIIRVKEKMAGAERPDVSQEFLIKVGRTERKIDLEDLVYVESQKEYVILHMKEEEMKTRIGISELVDQLPNNFLRIHRSFLINADFIRSFGSNSVEIGSIKLPLGRLYKNEAHIKWKKLD